MTEPSDLTRFLRYVKEKIYDVRTTLFKHVYNVELDRITYNYASLKTDINIPEDLYQAPLNIIRRVQELSCKGITFIGRDRGVLLNRTITIDFKQVIIFLESSPEVSTVTSKKRNLTEAGMQTFPDLDYKESTIDMIYSKLNLKETVNSIGQELLLRIPTAAMRAKLVHRICNRLCRKSKVKIAKLLKLKAFDLSKDKVVVDNICKFLRGAQRNNRGTLNSALKHAKNTIVHAIVSFGGVSMNYLASRLGLRKKYLWNIHKQYFKLSSNNNENIQVDGNETIQVDEDGSDDDSDTDTDSDHHDDALDTDDSVYSPSTASYDSDSDSDSTITIDEQKNCGEKTDAILQNIKTAGIRAKRSDFIDRQPLKDCFHSDSCPHIQIDMNSKTIYHTLDAIDPSIVHDCKQRLLTVSREVLYETWFLTNRERLNLPFMGKKTTNPTSGTN